MAYIGLVALVQEDMKKLIAYSSIAHMGFVTLGIFIAFGLMRGGDVRQDAAELGLQGAMVQMISHGFVSGATDLEKDQALVLELNLLVVDAARQQHRAVGPQQLVACETAPLRARAGGRSCARVGSGCQRRSLHVTKIITPEWML